MIAPRYILVVEDDAFIGMSIAETLSDSGYSPTLVSSLEAAQAALAAQRFDAATLDFRVRDRDCRSLVEALEKRCIPYIFCTGSLEDEVRESLATDAIVLGKPFYDADLLASVSMVLERSAAPA